MDNPADTLDQADEDILTYTVSDEALEAAAGLPGPLGHYGWTDQPEWCPTVQTVGLFCGDAQADG
jgi:hypothetical protein